MNDLQLANLACYSIYWATSDFDHVVEIDGVCAGIKGNVICFRGSTTWQDWERDFEAITLASPPDLPCQVGNGFQGGILKSMALIGYVDGSKPVIVTGHSLGAARAQLFTALLRHGNPSIDVTCVTFGTPRTGDAAFKDLFSTIPARAYLNTGDPIDNLPSALPGQPFVQACDRIEIYCEPIELDSWCFAREHHGQLYLAAMARHMLVDRSDGYDVK